MLLPEDPKATHIMVATGTGIAPYRAFLRRMFMENIPNYKFNGLSWLFLGVANSDSLLYHDEFSKYLEKFPEHFRYDIALSREQRNKNGGKMYVQDKIEEYGDELFQLLDEGAHMYFCGLKGMMPGIQETLKRVAEQKGIDWEEKLSTLKKNKQWHVEVY
jgi:ferredoxin--NADP+ reductase